MSVKWIHLILLKKNIKVEINGYFFYLFSMKGIEDTKTKLPELKNDGRMHVY